MSDLLSAAYDEFGDSPGRKVPAETPVPTAEEFAKAREALRCLFNFHGPDINGFMDEVAEDMNSDLHVLRRTLASAEPAIERLSKEAARWRAVRDDLAVWGDDSGWQITGNNYDYYPNPRPANVDEAADRLAGVSPPESEKP